MITQKVIYKTWINIRFNILFDTNQDRFLAQAFSSIMNWYAVDHRFLLPDVPFDLMFSIIARLSSSTSVVVSRKHIRVYVCQHDSNLVSRVVPTTRQIFAAHCRETPDTASIQNRRKYPEIHNETCPSESRRRNRQASSQR